MEIATSTPSGFTRLGAFDGNYDLYVHRRETDEMPINEIVVRLYTASGKRGVCYKGGEERGKQTYSGEAQPSCT